MTAKNDNAPVPYKPKEIVHVHVDLNDLCKKAATHGAARVLTETLLNLCLMANDQLSLSKGGALHGSTLANGLPKPVYKRTYKNIPRRSHH